MTRLLRRRHEKGATGIEYGMIAALIAVVVITAVSLLGTTLSGVFGGVANAISGGGTDEQPPAALCDANDHYAGPQRWVKVNRWWSDELAIVQTNYVTTSGDHWFDESDQPIGVPSDPGVMYDAYWEGSYEVPVVPGTFGGPLDSLMADGFTTYPTDGLRASATGSDGGCAQAGADRLEAAWRAANCTNGSFTGDTTGWYWETSAEYEHGMYFGDQWMGNQDYDPNNYTWDTKGSVAEIGDWGGAYGQPGKERLVIIFEHGSLTVTKPTSVPRQDPAAYVPIEGTDVDGVTSVYKGEPYSPWPEELRGAKLPTRWFVSPNAGGTWPMGTGVQYDTFPAQQGEAIIYDLGAHSCS